ncbi:potassium-transporting ATPase subunit KdpA [Niastella yeongjuensis]|uniref:Potassium-transporting ATPase potassium-binding subunit n=1 Tax=Niastella yeongjuensis TaxID=354355 RepID=A0A1V9FC75_9BACT|nr:potassium-transporting ATPase subunit KdpA [Niastella yeongjuensis]OQP55847.1 potassium-transporting ATPase subunit KdpA [Niastella yeongjuensis]SEP47331.1 K+-transporting ATPase ATPase A chain [Niastella yeongjuensis]
MYTEIFGVMIIFTLTVALAIPFGKYIAKVYSEEKTFLDPILYPIERFIYRFIRVDPNREMNWKQHLVTLLNINVIWFPLVFFILMNQDWLPMNPDKIPAMSPDLAFHSTCAFITNCNQQHYSGETGMSYLSQVVIMFSLFFLTPSITLAAMAVLFNALRERSTKKLGNFYNYYIRSITRILLPLSFAVAVIFLFNGIPMTFKGADTYTTLQGDISHVATGPIAAFESIKMLGLNGAGFFGVNSAHPFENPNQVTNIIENILHLLLPIATVFALGYYLKRKKLAWVIFGVMTLGFLLLLIPALHYELQGNPAITQMGIDNSIGNMEGKEIRFGNVGSTFWSITATAGMEGAVTSMHDSYMPLSGGMQLLGIMVNALYGGVGTGVLGFFIIIILTVFIGSLMVGRSPEVLGKKIGMREIKITVIITLLHPFLSLTGTALACAFPMLTTPTLNNPGFHGFTEMLYEYTSASSGSGSGFEGLGDNTPWWNISCAIVILIGRYLPIIGVVAIAGSLAEKKYMGDSPGTLKTDSVTFGLMVFGLIFIVAALTFFPAFALGPFAEHFSIISH